MKKNAIKMYEDYVSNNWDRQNLIEKLVKKYKIKSALYPGSYIHITPSFLIPRVTYVDSDKKAKMFFKDESIYSYIEKHKEYKGKMILQFYPSDYTSKFEDKEQQYDLLISQYAGFISQSCKNYLKYGGILIVNDSHGDASMAYLDNEYELIGVTNQSGSSWIISDENLENYFIPKKKIEITKEYLQQFGKEVKYKISASAYIFKKSKLILCENTIQ
ncbi:MAG: hypothetical protein WBG30_09030 [Psychrilyobacter sp.]|uniref:hypothetical protein n=1 Tax=Psychrilyobacter sp. TaxID=2586924 RepID=UPI003C72A88A